MWWNRKDTFQWFDKETCKIEFSRILKPRGKVVFVWNNSIVEESGFTVEYEELLKAYANDYKEVNHKLISYKEFNRFFKDSIFENVVFKNEQLFDFKGLKTRASFKLILMHTIS